MSDLIKFVSELEWFTAITSLSLLFWTSWFLCRRVGDLNALKIAQQKYGKCKIRRMGILSEMWQIMYESSNSPIIHGFEYGPNPDSGYHLLCEFWTSFSQKYINWRSIPIKINGRWFWKEIDDKDFNINNHCKRILLTSNGNTQKALTGFINNNNMNRPFTPNKPYWEAYYISFDDVENEAYCYGRFHHAIGDGVLLNRIAEMEHDILWNKKNTSPKKNNYEKKIIRKKSLFQKIKNIIFIIYNLIKYTPFSIIDLMSLFWIESAPLECGIHCDYFGKETDDYHKQRRFNMSISNKFLIKDIKKVCKKHGKYTINDFVMTIFCEAVYQYIFKYVCNNKQTEYDKITGQYGNKLYLRFFTVFNMRSLLSSDLQDLAMKYASGLSENEISTVPIRLPCGSMLFMERFNEIHNLFYKLKNGPMPIITSLIIKIGHCLFGLKFVNMILGKFTASKCTFTLSNLMGPKTPLLSGPSFDDDNKNKYVWNVFNGTNPTHTPLSCGIMSYVDYMTFTMAADQNAIYDPNQFMQCLNDVYQKSINQ